MLLFTFVFALQFFSKAFPNVEYENLPFSIICLWLEGNISSPVIYSYLSIFPDDNADTFAAFLLMLYYSFSSLIVSSVVMISFYILSKRFFLRRERLSDARVAGITVSTVLQNTFYKYLKNF